MIIYLLFVAILTQTTCYSNLVHSINSNILSNGRKNDKAWLMKFKRTAQTVSSASTDPAEIDTVKAPAIIAYTDNKQEEYKVNQPTVKMNLWPCGDDLDKRIIQLAGPAVLNLAIVPLVGAVDTFWVGRMKEALALAGQGAANQVFSSTSFVISFLPAIVTPLIAKAAAADDKKSVQKYVGEALFLGTIMGTLGTLALTVFTNKALRAVLMKNAPALDYARPYLFIRALTFLPSLISTVGFAVFRGKLDVVTPLKIAAISNFANLVLDPIFIFSLGMGISGAAAATCVAELISFGLFIKEMISARLINLKQLFKVPSLANLKPLLLGGLSIQMRALALNLAILSVVRRAQSLDTTGIAAAAHAITIQQWQLGAIFLFAMSTVANIIVPAELAKGEKENDPQAIYRAKFVADRMLRWGVILGLVLAGIQLLSLPMLKLFSPLPAVQDAARLPSIIAAVLQVMNGLVFIGESIQQGNQYFTSLALSTGIATVGMLVSLNLIGHSLPGIWLGFATFNGIRLLGVLQHHFISGPFAKKNIDEYIKRNSRQ